MATAPIEGIRVVVIARPALGRRIAETLGAIGYEVYRTPSGLGIAELHDRVRPDLAIVATELFGHDAVGAALELRAESGDLPVLLVGAATGDPRAADFPILSSVDPDCLATTVAHMLG
jgi:DNA-binding response OmpR family regulator